MVDAAVGVDRDVLDAVLRGRSLVGHRFLGLGLQHLLEQSGIGFQSP